MTNLWEIIKRLRASRAGEIGEHDAVPGSIPSAIAFQPVIASCLQLLHSCPTGTMLYLLDCLYPRDVSILDFADLDLDLPHHHRRLPKITVNLRLNSDENLLTSLRAYTSIIPAEDYPGFWLELARRCLLTCPIDPNDYQEDECGKELFCQRLRSELIERILRID